MLAEKGGLEMHGEMVAMLKRDLCLGHGDANTLVHHVKNADGASPAAASPDAALRPIHDALMKEIGKFGEFEVAPKKTYVGLRRTKQFATIGPATKTEVEIGLNSKTLKPRGKIV